MDKRYFIQSKLSSDVAASLKMADKYIRALRQELKDNVTNHYSEIIKSYVII